METLVCFVFLLAIVVFVGHSNDPRVREDGKEAQAEGIFRDA